MYPMTNDLPETNSHFHRRVFDAYFSRLIRLTEQRIGAGRRRVTDGEDVALSALGSFFRRYASDSRVRSLGENELWNLVATIARRKAINQVRNETRQKRGGGLVQGESVFQRIGNFREQLDDQPNSQQPPDEIAMTEEAIQTMLGALDQSECQIAVAKLEGYTNQEISQRIGCSVATVERRLRMIRSRWTNLLD